MLFFNSNLEMGPSHAARLDDGGLTLHISYRAPKTE